MSVNSIQSEEPTKNIETSNIGNYKMALVVGLCLSAFHQLSGINGVVFDSNEMFTKGNSGRQAEKAARIGTLFIAVSGFFGTAFSLLLSKHYGRKTIMIMGEVGMMICLFILGVCCLNHWEGLQIIFVNAFVFIFNATLGQGLWVYASEILPSKGMGLVAFVNMALTAVFGTFTNLFFKWLTDAGFFFTLAGFQVISLVFIVTLVIETQGKTKAELETLYQPKVVKRQSKRAQEHKKSTFRPASKAEKYF